MKILLLLILSFSAIASDKWSAKLFKSVKDNNIKLANKAIRKGADINSYNSIYNGKADQNTALTFALKYNRTEIAKLIVDAGADINLGRTIGEGNSTNGCCQTWKLRVFKLYCHSSRIKYKYD